jgi:hypothetical protein
MSVSVPIQSTDYPSTHNEPTGDAVLHPNGATEDLAADPSAEEVLHAIQTMVRNSAEKSMPKISKFMPKVELAPWSDADLVICEAALDEYVDARVAPVTLRVHDLEVENLDLVRRLAAVERLLSIPGPRKGRKAAA